MDPSKKEYFKQVENEQAFLDKQRKLHRDLASNELPYKSALEYLSVVNQFKYAYQWSWLGIPIIKLPEDILVIQEFFCWFRPQVVIEIGIARGGGLKLYSSLQKLLGIDVNVLGIDLKIFPHTRVALAEEVKAGIQLLEANSISPRSIKAVELMTANNQRTFVILDGDHSHEHVLQELKIYGSLLPIGSYILVADTITEDIELGENKRPWGKGNNPKTALTEFLASDDSWKIDLKWSRRATITESRDGWIVKLK